MLQVNQLLCYSQQRKYSNQSGLICGTVRHWLDKVLRSFKLISNELDHMCANNLLMPLSSDKRITQKRLLSHSVIRS